MTDDAQSVGGSQQVDEIHNGNPFNGAELVVFTADADHGAVEPATEAMEELGIISWSLWARFEEDGVEIPIVGENSNPVWYSLSPDSFHPDPADPVSDAFIRGICEMVDEDVGEGWGDLREETWEAMPKIERYIWGTTKHGFLKMDGAEPALVIDWCEAQEVSDDV